MSSRSALRGLEAPPGAAELERAIRGLRLHSGLLFLILALAMALAMGWGYSATQVSATLFLDGNRVSLRTHQTTVGALLAEQGLILGPDDIVLPGRSASLQDGLSISVRRARAILLEVGGETRLRPTHARSVGEALRTAGISVAPQDRLFLEDRQVTLESPLPAIALVGERAQPLRLSLRPPVTLQVVEGGIPLTFESTAPTLGQALWQEGLYLYAGDEVRPSLETPLTLGMRVFIVRGVPLTLQVDGRAAPLRVAGETVADALIRTGIELRGSDYTVPPLETPLSAQMNVRVVRVTERFVLEGSSVPFETRWISDAELELDQWRVVQAGAEGLRRRLVKIVFEDGVETGRSVEQEWIAREPSTRVLAYGTRIVVRELSSPAGPLRYWRHLRMLATSYTAATSGKPRDHPAYGITRTGIRATRGVVAVDPRVIRLGTRVYVPGYGMAVAADTGGAIKGRRIDLAYEEDQLVLWRLWVDVYLLEPIPPPEQMLWIIPGWPAER